MLGKVVLKIEGVNVAKTLEALKTKFKITKILRVHSTQTILTAQVNSCAKLIDYLKQKCYNVYVVKFSLLLKANIFFRKFWLQTVLFLICFALLCSLQFFVFGVNYKQNDATINQKIDEVLSDMHILGKQKMQIDAKELEQNVLTAVPEISLIDISFNGCFLVVNYTTKTFELEVQQKNEGPLIATGEGLVSQIFCVSGTLMVSVGTYVKPGQILIANYFVDKDGNTVPCEAKGQIYVDVWQNTVVQFCEDQIEYAPTGREVRETTILTLNKQIQSKQIEIPFEHYETMVEQQKLSSTAIPIDVIFTTYVETTPIRIHVPFAEKEDSLKLQAKDEFWKKYPNFDILEEKFTVSTASNVYFVTYYAKTKMLVT